MAVLDGIGEEVLDDGVELAHIDPHVEGLVGVDVPDGLPLGLGESLDTLHLGLEVGDGLDLLDAHDASLDARQLVLHHLIGHLCQGVGIAQCERHGLALLDVERVALAEFLEGGLDEGEGSAYVVCGVDEEVDLLFRRVHVVSCFDIPHHLVEDDSQHEQLEEDACEGEVEGGLHGDEQFALVEHAARLIGHDAHRELVTPVGKVAQGDESLFSEWLPRSYLLAVDLPHDVAV